MLKRKIGYDEVHNRMSYVNRPGNRLGRMIFSSKRFPKISDVNFTHRETHGEITESLTFTATAANGEQLHYRIETLKEIEASRTKILSSQADTHDKVGKQQSASIIRFKNIYDLLAANRAIRVDNDATFSISDEQGTELPVSYADRVNAAHLLIKPLIPTPILTIVGVLSRP